MNIYNYTPNPVTIKVGSASLTFPINSLAWVSEWQKIVKHISLNGRIIPIYETNYGKIEGLPEPQDEVYFIVSKEVAQAAVDRSDLLYPNVCESTEKNTSIMELLSFSKENISISKSKMETLSHVLFDAYSKLQCALKTEDRDREDEEYLNTLKNVMFEIQELVR